MKEDVEKIEGIGNDAVRRHDGETDIKKLVGEENDTFLLSEEKKDAEKLEGRENNSAHPRQGKNAIEKEKGAADDAIHLNEGTNDIKEPEGAAENGAVHLSKGKKDVDKSESAENGAGHFLEEKKDAGRPKCTKNGTVPLSEEINDIKYPKGTDDGAVCLSEETNDVGKPEGVENNALTQINSGHGTTRSDDNNTQISSHEDQIETTIERKSDGQRPEVVVDGGKHSVQTDEEKGSNDYQGQSTSRPDADRNESIVVTEVAAHIRDDKEGHSQPIDDEIGVIPSESNNAGNPLNDGAERHVQATENPTDHDGRGKGVNPDNNDVKSTVQSGNGSKLATAGQASASVKTGKTDPSEGSDQAVESMTVIFHALLTPTFDINFQQGDKVFLRGDSPFSWKTGQQLEIQAVRYDFLFLTFL